MLPERPFRAPFVGDTVQFKYHGKWVAAIITHVDKNGACDLTIFPRGYQIMVVSGSFRGDGAGNWRWPVGGRVAN